MSLPSHVRVVIVGGGIAGCSTAYHLGRSKKKTENCSSTTRDAESADTIRRLEQIDRKAAKSFEIPRSQEGPRFLAAPRSDPCERGYRTGLLPWVMTLNRRSGNGCRRRERMAVLIHRTSL